MRSTSIEQFGRIRFVAATVALVAGALALGTASGAARAEPFRHLRLTGSSPAADEVIHESPAAIRLTFSEVPAENGRSVRLTRGTDTDDLVPTTAVAPDPQDPKVLVVRPERPLGNGDYTVHWRVLAADGHAQNGTFGFRIAPE